MGTLTTHRAERTAPRRVGIIGGMGPLAGAEFLRLFVLACTAHLRSRGETITDQVFPEHWMVQVPCPDRSVALLGSGDSPLPNLREALTGLLLHRVEYVAIACDTAHGWHAELQSEFAQTELLHIVQETVRHLTNVGERCVGLLASSGMHQLGLYEKAFEGAGFRCHTPLDHERNEIMEGIYEVKSRNLDAAENLFTGAASNLIERTGCRTLVMGCTEIPLALRQLNGSNAIRLVNPASVLADALAVRAYTPFD